MFSFKEALRPVVVPVRESPPCKFIIKTLERTDFVQNLALDFVYLRLRADLTKEEREKFREAINKIKKGEPVPFSQHEGIIKKGGVEITGIESLDQLENTGVLILSNHMADGPLKGYGQMITTSSAVKKRTGKEIIWTHGEDKSTFQNTARKKIEKSAGTILVRGSTATEGTRRIIKSFQRNNIVGIHLEGDGSDKLGRAVADAGHFILYAAKKGIPIICSAGFFDQETGKLKINFFKIDPEEIREFVKDETKNQEVILENRQRIADYAMIEIAKRLPFEKRGFYTNFVLSFS